VTRDDQQYMD